MTLIDIRQKRIRFLQNVLACLSLQNVTTRAERFESIKQSYHIVLARALAPFDAAIGKQLFFLTKKGGILLAYKSKHKMLARERAALLESFHVVKQVDSQQKITRHCFLIAKA